MKVVVGSTNPVKVSAVKEVLKETNYEVISFDSPSGVSNQPFSDVETLEGAAHRAKLCLSKGEIGIGLEAGVEYYLKITYNVYASNTATSLTLNIQNTAN